MPDAVNGMTAPFFSYDDLRQKANQFLAQHHRAGTIPVPIEEIVEFQFHINIVPMPDLQRTFDVVSFLTSDLREIRVDDFVYRNRPGRYRFSLAHEMGHRVLHRDLYRQHRFASISEWKQFVTSAPDREYRFLEWHANTFAACVLVPGDQLLAEATKCVDLIKSTHLDLAANWDYAWTQIAASLADPFEVSNQVIERRLEKENISDRFA